jgi:hypothetical protein
MVAAATTMAVRTEDMEMDTTDTAARRSIPITRIPTIRIFQASGSATVRSILVRFPTMAMATLEATQNRRHRPTTPRTTRHRLSSRP